MSEAGYIFDASALLALLLKERGADAIKAMLPRAHISSVNLSEVVAKLQERGIPDPVIVSSLAELEIDVVAFDRDQAMRAGLLRVATRSSGLSFGDRACLAVAGLMQMVAVTTDRAWATLDIGVTVEVAR